MIIFFHQRARNHCSNRRHGRTGGEVDGGAVVCGDRVVFASGDGRLYLLELATGRKLWAYDLGSAVATSPAVADGWVIVGTDDGTVYAFR